MTKFILILFMGLTCLAQQPPVSGHQAPAMGNSSGGGGVTPESECGITGFPLRHITACIKQEGVVVSWKPIPLGAVVGYDIYQCDTTFPVKMATRLAFTKDSFYLIPNPKVGDKTRYCVVPVSPEYCHHYAISAPIEPVDCDKH